MPLAITQPPFQLEVAGKSLKQQQALYKGKRFDSISGRVRRKRIDAQHVQECNRQTSPFAVALSPLYSQLANSRLSFY